MAIMKFEVSQKSRLLSPKFFESSTVGLIFKVH